MALSGTHTSAKADDVAKLRWFCLTSVCRVHRT